MRSGAPDRSSSLWPGRILLAGLALWFAWDLVRTLIFAMQSWGLAGLADAVLAFRLGAALVVIPLGYALLPSSWGTGVLRRERWLMWAGALLAGVAYLGLAGRIAWAPLALLVAAVGLLLPWLARIRSERAARALTWAGLAFLLLLHLAGYAAGFLFHGYTVVPYPAAYPRPADGRDERWQQDVRYLSSELARLHMNAFHTTSEEAHRSQVEVLLAAIPNLNDGQITVELMRLVAATGDAHTEFAIFDSVPLHFLPADLRWYGDGLYVRGISEAYPQAVGAQVLKIGSLTAEEAYQAVLPLISHENDSWARLKSSNYLNVAELLEAVGVVAQAGAVPFTLKDESGREFAVSIDPLEPGQAVDFLSARIQPAFYQSRPDEPFWYEYRASSNTLYFRYAACTDPFGFRATVAEMWRLADERPVERLIVDLRGNGGGNSLQFERWFLPGLAARPALDDPDRLFVLIDKGTFSSASDNAASMLVHTNATFVGEPTGGKPNSYGEVRYFRLLNSRAMVFYSTNYFETLPGSDPPSIEPHIFVAPSAAEVFAGRDPVLEYIAPDEEW